VIHSTKQHGAAIIIAALFFVFFRHIEKKRYFGGPMVLNGA
jgi:hypothetical protein